MQIGPRIRVGGTLGHIGQQAKLAVGKVAKNPLVDAAVSFIPGVGPIAAGALGALGTALDTSHGSVGLGQIGLHGLEGYGAAKFAHLIPGLGASGGGGSAAGSLAGAAPGQVASAIPDSAFGSPVAQSVMGRVMGAAGNIGSFAKNNQAGLELAGHAAGGILSANAQNKQAAIDQQRANSESDQVNAAIAKQKAIQAAFAQMYGQGGLPPHPQIQPPHPVAAPVPSPVASSVMSRVMGRPDEEDQPYPSYAGYQPQGMQRMGGY